MGIRESLLNTITSVGVGDFVRVVTSAGASSKATVQNIAKSIIENYSGSSLGGSSRSVKSAIDSLNSKWSLTPVRLLNWGTYSNGTYTLNEAIQVNMLMRIWIGYSGKYGVVRGCPNTGDTLKYYTEDGWLNITFDSTTQITISGAGTNSPVREMCIYPDIKLAS